LITTVAGNLISLHQKVFGFFGFINHCSSFHDTARPKKKPRLWFWI
jgi:hypothetical protein